MNAARVVGCACAHNRDGSVTTFLCPIHADSDPCATMAQWSGKRRKGTIRRGICTHCGWQAARVDLWKLERFMENNPELVGYGVWCNYVDLRRKVESY